MNVIKTRIKQEDYSIDGGMYWFTPYYIQEISAEQAIIDSLTSALNKIEAHIGHIKKVFLSPKYVDELMGYIVEDHIIAIDSILASV